MQRLKRLRPSPALTVAFMALFVAGAGTATAAGLITGKQIKNSSITTKDIKNKSLLKKDFKSGQLPAGPKGLAGQNGRAGRDGFGQVVYVLGGSNTVDHGEQAGDEAVCPAGTTVVGGGVVSESSVGGQQAVNSSYPSDGQATGNVGNRGWIAFVDNNTTTATPTDGLGLQAYAICANGNVITPFPAKAKGNGKRLR